MRTVIGKKPTPPGDWKGHTEYFELTVPPDLMVALGDLLDGKKVPGEAIGRLRGVWQFGRRVRLPYARLPWSEVEFEATRQHIGEAEVLFDKMGKGKEPA